MGPVTKNVKSGSIITAGGNDCSLIEKFDLCVVLGLKSRTVSLSWAQGLDQSALCCKRLVSQ